LTTDQAARKRTFEYTANEAARQQTTETLQKLYDGKLRLERRNGGSKIYARTYLQGRSISTALAR